MNLTVQENLIITTYADKLLDPRWQKKRLRIFERDNWTCQNCGDSKKTLHIHHNYYLPYVEPWNYPDDALITLCKNCHEKEQPKSQEQLLYEAMIDAYQFIYYSQSNAEVEYWYNILNDLREQRQLCVESVNC